MAEVPEAPTRGCVSDRACMQQILADAIEPNGTQIRRRIRAEDFIECILDRAPADAQPQAQVSNRQRAIRRRFHQFAHGAHQLPVARRSGMRVGIADIHSKSDSPTITARSKLAHTLASASDDGAHVTASSRPASVLLNACNRTGSALSTPG